MSQETLNWLNENVLIGFTGKRGNAWHYRASEQGAEPNHYTSAIPVGDVERRLFDWEPLEGDVSSTVLTTDGVTTFHDPTRKTYIHPKTGEFMGVFKQSHKAHPYRQWLLRNCEVIMDSTDLQIASAGLLRGGAVAWVQYELEESMTAAGLEFRPFLTAATSFDGSLASTYTHGSQAVVCDNTLAGAQADKSQQIKVRHSSLSLGRIGDVRDALGVFAASGPAFVEHIEGLAAMKISDKIFARFLDGLTASRDGKPLTGKAITIAETKRAQIEHLYRNDERAATWTGTGLGAYMAVNTWEQHFQHVRNMPRVERNSLNLVEGKTARADADTLTLLRKVAATR